MQRESNFQPGERERSRRKNDYFQMMEHLFEVESDETKELSYLEGT